jgi:hypothetical protein
MKESVKSKTVVVSVIFLFIALAVAPGINVNVVNASSDNDLVEFTTEACGIPGLKPQTVKLTKQQASDVEELFDEIKNNLDNATTKEETVAIFDHAVVDLDEYGLLGGLSVEEAQRLVKRSYQNPQAMNLYNTMYGNCKIFNGSNFLCLIAGETKVTRFYSVVETGCSVLCYFLFGMYIVAHIFVDDPVVFYNIISRLQAISNLYHTVNSVRIIGTGGIAFGSSHYSELPPPYRYNPAVGWITTQGVIGKKSWNGSFYGGILGLVTFDSSSYSYYIGATGFLGIKVNMYDGSLFFLGSAFRVKISPENTLLP